MKEMTIAEMKSASVEVLKDVHAFCVENNIRYALGYGTLIGAIRHKGFIPWDDDIDIIMPRPDYDRFVRTYRDRGDYELFSREADKALGGKDSMLFAYSRVVECRRTFVDASHAPFAKEECGVFVDLFPMDAVSDSPAIHKCWLRVMKMLWMLGHAKRSAKRIDLSRRHGRNKLFWVMMKVVYPLLSYRVIDWHIALAKRLSWDRARYYANNTFFAYGMRERQRKECFETVVPVEFEGNTFWAPNGYDEILRNIYGDYMQLPPEDKRRPGHSFYKFYWKE